ncbi:MAG: hypothetical protein ACLTNS_16580, partial [Acutalibacteraceae bacterium]
LVWSGLVWSGLVWSGLVCALRHACDRSFPKSSAILFYFNRIRPRFQVAGRIYSVLTFSGGLL